MTSILINTDYTLNDKNIVEAVTWSTNSGTCTATLIPESETYTYSSNLDGDTKAVEAPAPMSLADCILAANVHLGLIPAHNFDPIPCPNAH